MFGVFTLVAWKAAFTVGNSNAYFADELKEEFNFASAFEGARVRIQARETEEEKTPSMPQIASAPAILEKLEELETRLRSNASAR